MPYKFVEVAIRSPIEVSGNDGGLSNKLIKDARRAESKSRIIPGIGYEYLGCPSIAGKKVSTCSVNNSALCTVAGVDQKDEDNRIIITMQPQTYAS